MRIFYKLLFFLILSGLITAQSLCVPSTLEQGLIAYYPFNGNANDASGNGHNGTLNGNPTLTNDRHGNPNSAYRFDGIDDWINVPDSPDLRLANTDFTICAWVYETERNSSYNDAILTKRGDGNKNGWFFSIAGNASGSSNVGKIFFQNSGGNDPSIVGTTVIPLNSWHFVVATYDLETTTINLYLDGIIDGTKNSIPPPSSNTTNNMAIGKDIKNAYNGYYFHGIIDDIRIYNRILTQDEITKLLNE